MGQVRLVCKEPFHSFGKSYEVGDEIDQADAAAWPGRGTLARRLENKFCAYEEEIEAEGISAEVATATAKAKAVIKTK